MPWKACSTRGARGGPRGSRASARWGTLLSAGRSAPGVRDRALRFAQSIAQTERPCAQAYPGQYTEECAKIPPATVRGPYFGGGGGGGGRRRLVVHARREVEEEVLERLLLSREVLLSCTSPGCRPMGAPPAWRSVKTALPQYCLPFIFGPASTGMPPMGVLKERYFGVAVLLRSRRSSGRSCPSSRSPRCRRRPSG